MKKIKYILFTIISTAILTLLCLKLPDSTTQENFFTINISFFTTIILSLIQFFVVRNYSKRIAFSGVILLFFIYSIFAWAMSIESLYFTRLAIILTQTAIIFFVIVCYFIIKDKTKRSIKQEVSKYLADQVIENIDNNISTNSTGTKEVLTIMFVDIRGFTTISEKYSAQEVTEILNGYFREIIPVVKKNNGVINKFIGDAMLIVFNNKNIQTQAQNAVKAGKAILRKLKNLQQIQAVEGKEQITAGIGINTGEVFIGYIGSEDRCEYTVIGDTVNIASRTESANRLYKTEFLITENTYKYVKDIADVIKISDVQLKGKREKVNVYEVLRVKDFE